MCVYIYIRIYVCIWVHVHVRVRINVHVHMRVCTHINYVHVQILHMYIYAYMYMYKYPLSYRHPLRLLSYVQLCSITFLNEHGRGKSLNMKYAKTSNVQKYVLFKFVIDLVI